MYIVTHKGKVIAQNFTRKDAAEKYKKKYFLEYATTKMVDLKVKKVNKSNPSLPKNKFISCKAVKFNKNGSVSIKK